MPRWIILILLVPLAVAVGFLLALFIPRGDAPGEPTPILITTQTIPPAQP